MPKARRSKVVSSSTTKKKGRGRKEELVAAIRDCVARFPSVYVFTLHNPRTDVLQQIRNDRRDDSRIFLGSNKVMQVAIGRDPKTSQAPNLFKLSRFLNGMSGLLFTTLPKKEAKQFCASIGCRVFARPGQRSTVKLEVPAGPLPFPHSMFDQVAKLGFRIQLVKGVITLLNDTTVCDVGDVLTTETAHILKLFGIQAADFSMELAASWTDNVARKMASA